jgi:hypothetical protein
MSAPVDPHDAAGAQRRDDALHAGGRDDAALRGGAPDDVQRAAARDDGLHARGRVAGDHAHGVPGGHRQGLITAITVLLAFTLAFFRFWGFEAPGAWTVASAIVAVALLAALLMQVVALWRSLRLEDDEPREYRITVRWFFASAVVLLVGLVLAALVFD